MMTGVSGIEIGRVRVIATRASASVNMTVTTIMIAVITETEIEIGIVDTVIVPLGAPIVSMTASINLFLLSLELT